MQVAGTKVVVGEDARAEALVLMARSLRGGLLAMGENVARFEAAFAAAQGLDHAVATSSCTSALEIAYRCFGVAGREVVVPTNTFYATAAAARHAGADVVFCDVDPYTMVPTPEMVERKLTPRTAAVAWVHVAGHVQGEVEEVAELCRRRGVKLVEDAAHAHGSTLGGVPAGMFGDAAAFSFYPTKVLTAVEGGALRLADPGLLPKARSLRDHGKLEGHPHLQVCDGSNWRMSELHAAVGLTQAQRLAKILEERRTIAGWYLTRLLGHHKLTVHAPPLRCGPNWYKMAVTPAAEVCREDLRNTLLIQGVGLAGEVFRVPLHKQPVFRTGESLPGAESFCSRHLCLPLYLGLTRDEVNFVCDNLLEALP